MYFTINNISKCPFLMLYTDVMSSRLMLAYPFRFIVGGFLAIATKNISTSFSVDLSTTVKFTFNNLV